MSIGCKVYISHCGNCKCKSSRPDVLYERWNMEYIPCCRGCYMTYTSQQPACSCAESETCEDEGYPCQRDTNASPTPGNSLVRCDQATCNDCCDTNRRTYCKDCYMRYFNTQAPCSCVKPDYNPLEENGEYPRQKNTSKLCTRTSDPGDDCTKARKKTCFKDCHIPQASSCFKLCYSPHEEIGEYPCQKKNADFPPVKDCLGTACELCPSAAAEDTLNESKQKPRPCCKDCYMTHLSPQPLCLCKADCCVVTENDGYPYQKPVIDSCPPLDSGIERVFTPAGDRSNELNMEHRPCCKDCYMTQLSPQPICPCKPSHCAVTENDGYPCQKPALVCNSPPDSCPHEDATMELSTHHEVSCTYPTPTHPHCCCTKPTCHAQEFDGYPRQREDCLVLASGRPTSTHACNGLNEDTNKDQALCCKDCQVMKSDCYHFEDDEEPCHCHKEKPIYCASRQCCPMSNIHFMSSQGCHTEEYHDEPEQCCQGCCMECTPHTPDQFHVCVCPSPSCSMAQCNNNCHSIPCTSHPSTLSNFIPDAQGTKCSTCSSTISEPQKSLKKLAVHVFPLMADSPIYFVPSNRTQSPRCNKKCCVCLCSSSHIRTSPPQCCKKNIACPCSTSSSILTPPPCGQLIPPCSCSPPSYIPTPCNCTSSPSIPSSLQHCQLVPSCCSASCPCVLTHCPCCQPASPCCRSRCVLAVEDNPAPP